MNDLENRLQDALTEQAREVSVRGDAWQRNQQRLLNHRTTRAARRLRVAGVAAAVVALLAFVAPSVPTLRDAVEGGAGDNRPQLLEDGRVGRSVRLAEVTRGGETVPYEAYLNADRGDLQFCEIYEIASVGTGSCVTADSGDEGVKPGVLPFLVQRINDNDTQQGFAGAVTSRVERVQAWRVDGTRMSLPLEDLGFDGLEAFGFYRARGQQPVQRVVLSGPGGRVLHTVDLSESTMAAPFDSCRAMSAQQPVPDTISTATVRPAEARIVPAGDAARSVCLPLRKTLQAVLQDDRTAVLVLAPEVSAVELRHLGSTTAQLSTTQPRPNGTIWRVLAFPVDFAFADGDRFVALDASRAELESVPVSSPP